MINKGIVINVIGILIMLLGSFMLLALPFSIGEGSRPAIIWAAFLAGISGCSMWYLTRNTSRAIHKKEGFLIVAGGWIAVSLFSALPYYFSGVLPTVSQAVFESVSGLTTTGATVILDIESVPRAILFWRSLTQWIGGMGIIVLTVAIFPLLGIGGVELFVAEAPGPTSDKIHPRIKETAKRLWFIYLGLTLSLVIVLAVAGMNFFDALNHALTTMATGGFSTKNASIAYFESPVIHYILIVYMFIAGTNYTVLYFAVRGRFKSVIRSDEFKTYTALFGLLVLSVTAVLLISGNTAWEQSFREAAFQTISLLTTTGYVTADYTQWGTLLIFVFFLLLFIGACAGSTSGGIKIIRHLVLFKNSVLELKRLLHPKAIIRIKVDGEIVAPRVLTHILVFFLFYLLLFVAGSLFMMVIFRDFDQPFLSSIGAVATSLGNVGPAIADLGPAENFAKVPVTGKWILIVLMLLGRLELFTLLVIFSPYFWKRN